MRLLKSPEPTPLKGYRRKPLWIPAIGAFLLLSPWVSFVLAVRRAGEPRWFSPAAWMPFFKKIPVEGWCVLALVMAAGGCLLYARKIAWRTGLLALVAVCLASLAAFGRVPGLALLTLGVLLAQPIRRPYLMKQLRWWETAPRFRVDLQAQLAGCGQRVHVVNLSVSGALLEKCELPEGEFALELFSGLEVGCRAVRMDPQGRPGVQFQGMTRGQRRKLKAWLKVNSLSDARAPEATTPIAAPAGDERKAA